jgi:hypothetical protein
MSARSAVKKGPKQGQNTAETSFSAPDPEAEESAKEFFNTLRFSRKLY